MNTAAPITYTRETLSLDQLERLVYDAVGTGAHTFKAVIEAIPAESHIRLRDWHKRVRSTLNKLTKQKLLKETEHGWIRK